MIDLQVETETLGPNNQKDHFKPLWTFQHLEVKHAIFGIAEMFRDGNESFNMDGRAPVAWRSGFLGFMMPKVYCFVMHVLTI